MNPSTTMATVLVDELVRLGVRHAVLCPGSRSAPLAYALEKADRAGRLTLHVRIDERSAGFVALGIGKVTGVPAVVVTTSGTAVANLHPAVLEASEATVPMLLLTADRPPELRGTRANQTADQLKIFGSAVRLFHDLATPGKNDATAPWRTCVDRAYAAATGALGADPGPAHLNVPFREPLVPDLDPDPSPDEEVSVDVSQVGRADGDPWTRVPTDRPHVRPSGRSPLARELSDGPERTLVVLGDLPDARLAAELAGWADGRGWPVLAEPFGTRSPGAFLPFAGLLAHLPSHLEALRPERIVVGGRITLSRQVAGLLRLPGLRVDLLTPSARWPDPGHVVHAVHPWPVFPDDAPENAAPWATSADEALQADTPVVTSWARAWHAAADAVTHEVGALLDGMWPFGPAVAREVLSAAPSGTLLYTGSSSVVRDLDLTRQEDRAWVVANRGLAGIDGTVSSAVGAALAASDRPAVALMGDLTFLHDANGLLIGPAEPRPDLTVVVLNDDGGGIFGLLEYGDPARAGQFERVFGTSTGTRIADLCRAHHVTHVLARTRGELAAAVSTRPEGIRVVEICIDRASQRASHERLRAVAVQAASQALG